MQVLISQPHENEDLHSPTPFMVALLWDVKNNVKTVHRENQPKLFRFFDLSDKEADGLKINLDFDRVLQI